MSAVNNGSDYGIYVWRDPRLGGYPIEDSSDISGLVEFAKKKKIKRILYDNWGTGLTQNNGEWNAGSGRQSGNFLDELILNAHEHSILVEALYTDNNRFGDVIEHNRSGQNKFDGIRMNYEGPWNLGPASHSQERAFEPVSEGDISYFATAKQKTGAKPIHKIPSWVKNAARWWADGTTSDSEFINAIQYMIREGVIQISSSVSNPSGNTAIPDWIKNAARWWADGTTSDSEFINAIQYMIRDGIIKVPRTVASSGESIPLYASISWHWGRQDVDNPDSPIGYNGNEKFAFQHILDIVDGVDIQTAWGGPNAVDSIMFRVAPIIKYARNVNKPAWITIETSDQAPPNQTFLDEGIDNIENTSQALLTALRSEDLTPAGIIYHFYMNSYK